MKATTLSLPSNVLKVEGESRQSIHVSLDGRQLTRAALTLAGPVVLVILSTWAVTLGLTTLVPASLWLTGLVLMALALDHDSASTALTLGVSAAVTLVLALVALHLAPEFAIFASVIPGSWLGIACSGVLRRQSITLDDE